MDLAYYIKGARSAEGMRRRLERSGFTISGHRLWTKDELTIVRLYYPYLGCALFRLRGRTEGAIRAKAREMGLCRHHVHRWTAAEVSKLRRFYPTASREELCAMIPGVSWTALSAAARRYGFRRKKKLYKITGIEPLDAVRIRCYEIKWTMKNLDEECRTKRYFQTRGYRIDYPNFQAINRAVEMFGGELRVHWMDQIG